MIGQVPGAGDHLIRVQRLHIDKRLGEFQQQADAMQTDLRCALGVVLAAACA